MNELTFFITKASEADGVRRWDAKVSEFAVDPQKDEVTPEFYEHSAKSIAAGKHPAPALVVSHLDDTSPEQALEPTPDIFAAGWATEVYVDGSIPKARGVFVNNPLGDAVYAAVKADIENEVSDDERVQISMAWHPEEGGVEKSGDVRRHLRGVIKHFAATRAPIVKTTEITVKSEEGKMTKLDDAKTIVGDDLAGDLAEAYQERRNKSDTDDVVVEKADPDNTDSEETPSTVIVGDAVAEIIADTPTTPVDETGLPGTTKSEVEITEKAMREPTRMSACIEKHVQDGKTREESINLCLKDVKKHGVVIETAIKSDTDEPVILKQIFSSHGEGRQFPRGGGGGGFGPFPKREKIEDCVNRLMAEMEMPYAAALTTCQNRTSKRLGLLSRSEFGEVVSKPDMDYETVDDCVQSYVDDGMTKEEAHNHCSDKDKMKADLVQKPKLGAPMGECIQSYMAEGMKKDQAVAICLSNEHKSARKKSGTEDGEIDAVLRALLMDDEIAYVAPDVIVKSEAGSDHPATHYLVAADPKKPPTWHLLVRKANGSADETLMRSAWEALNGGTYKGPMKDEAISRLESLYEEEQFPYPMNSEFLEHAALEDILLVELLKSETAIDSLMEEVAEMTVKANGDSGQPVEETVEAENVEVEETVEPKTKGAVKADAEVSEVEVKPETEEVDADVEKAATGESETVDADATPTTDVNESDVASEAVKSDAVSEDFENVDAIVTEIKAALADQTLDRSGQVLIVNTLLKQLGDEADSAIKQTPPSDNDTAEAFKAGVVEIVDPLVERINILEAEKADLKQKLDASDWGGVVKPRPTQLSYEGVQKSDVKEKSGALTSDEVAEQSVAYDRPVY